MKSAVAERWNHDLRRPAVVHSVALPWTPSPVPGVERHFLERDGGEVARATSIVRYAAGSSFPAHVHGRGEEYLVLEGTFSDEAGDFDAGTYVRNPPGSSHAPFSREGCTIFVKLRQMDAADRAAVVVRTGHGAAVATDVAGISRIELHRGASESVAIEVLAPGTRRADRGAASGGEEILVLEGSLRYGDEACVPGTWLRFPAGAERPLVSASGCRLWVKRGHLGGGRRAG